MRLKPYKLIKMPPWLKQQKNTAFSCSWEPYKLKKKQIKMPPWLNEEKTGSSCRWQAYKLKKGHFCENNFKKPS